MPVFCRPFIFPALVSLFYSCSAPTQQQAPRAADLEANADNVREQFVTANKQLLVKENDEMDYYARSHKMPFVRTNSGIRYYVYEPSAAGDSIVEGSEVTMEYKVYLMDGTLCYSSDTDGARTFVVGQENIESGIHKGLQYLKRGDQALLLIPSPLAHGLLGDFKKIPPQMPIVYDVRVK